MAKFKNKYRIESNRLKGWDYGANALYFVTICCKNRKHFFGEIKNGKMKLSPIGHIANSCWVEIPNHFSFVVLHNHIIMPNHMHGIIEIAKCDDAVDDGNMDGVVDDAQGVQTPNMNAMDDAVQTPKLGVCTAAADSADSADATKKWKPNTLGSIINQYKRICTINARIINPDFAWQPNYHDHIIRNQKSFQNIANYIFNNPMKWNEDTFHSKNSNSNK